MLFLHILHLVVQYTLWMVTALIRSCYDWSLAVEYPTVRPIIVIRFSVLGSYIYLLHIRLITHSFFEALNDLPVVLVPGHPIEALFPIAMMRH